MMPKWSQDGLQDAPLGDFLALCWLIVAVLGAILGLRWATWNLRWATWHAFWFVLAIFVGSQTRKARYRKPLKNPWFWLVFKKFGRSWGLMLRFVCAYVGSCWCLGCHLELFLCSCSPFRRRVAPRLRQDDPTQLHIAPSCSKTARQDFLNP